MPNQTATTEPTQIRSGDSAGWTISNSDYPASDGWSLKYVLSVQGTKHEFTSTADGDSHVIALTSEVTKGWQAGTYGWSAAYIKDSERYTERTGTLEVLPNLIDGAGVDTRSTAAVVVESLRAAIKDLAANPTKRFSAVAGRDYERHTLAELRKELLIWESRLNAEIAQSNAARGIPRARTRVIMGGAR